MKKFAVVLMTAFTAACVPQAPAPAPSPPPPVQAAAPPPAPVAAPSDAQVAPGHWNVARVRCSDLLGAADEDRASVAMFYYGYRVAKAGMRVVDVNQIDNNVRKMMDTCAAAPTMTVLQATRQALR